MNITNIEEAKKYLDTLTNLDIKGFQGSKIIKTFALLHYKLLNFNEPKPCELWAKEYLTEKKQTSNNSPMISPDASSTVAYSNSVTTSYEGTVQASLKSDDPMDIVDDGEQSIDAMDIVNDTYYQYK